MTTQSFGYSGTRKSFNIPSYVSEVYLHLTGAEGGYGGQGGLGGIVTGYKSVVPGDTLYFYVGESPEDDKAGWPNGGSGDSTGDGNLSSTSGGGGGSSTLRYNGDTRSDTIIVAGGGGGTGEADGDDKNVGHGGNHGTDGEDADYVSGGTGGGNSNWSGDSGGATKETDSNGNTSTAAGGGGGGGYYAGGAGEHYADGYNAAGAGGGGGTNYVGGVSNASSGGANDGHGLIEIEYVKRPTDVQTSLLTNKNIEITWTDNSNESGFEVYRSTTSGVTTADTKVASLSSNTTSFIDSYSSIPSSREFYYRVRSLESHTSEMSNEVKQRFVPVKHYNGTSFNERSTRVYQNGSWVVPDSIEGYDGTAWK